MIVVTIIDYSGVCKEKFFLLNRLVILHNRFSRESCHGKLLRQLHAIATITSET